MAESALRQIPTQSAEPVVRSYNPFNPAFRDTVRSGINELIGGREMGGTPTQRYRAGMADLLTGGVDVVPGLDLALGMTDTVQAAKGGNYGTAAMLGGATVLGMAPVIGDFASKAIRGGLDMSQAARLTPNAAEDSFTVYQGTPHVFGPNQLVRDVQTGKEYVSDPNMVRAISAANPDRYEVLADNPLGIFDINRLGTGEGAQAYSYGVYTAESPDVGRFYRGSLLKRSGIDDTPMIGNKPIQDLYSEIEQRASTLPTDAASKEYEKLSILEQVMIDGDLLGVMQNKEYYSPEAFDWLNKNITPKFNRPGALYEAQINAPKSMFLDWDKPVTAQSPDVLERLQKAGIYDPEVENKISLLENEKDLLSMDRDPATNNMRNERRFMEAWGEIDALRKKQPKNMTGRQAYYASAPSATDQAAATNALRDIGIEGVSYLDAGSRMAGEESRNYVLFNPQKANIIAKYGVGGATIGLSALRNIQRDEEPQRRPD